MPEHPCRPLELDLVGPDTGSLKALPYQILVAPVHGAHEAFGWRGSVGAADLQDLGDQRRIARNPVAHDNASAAPRDPDHLASNVEWPWREHGAENADHEVEPVVHDARKI